MFPGNPSYKEALQPFQPNLHHLTMHDDSQQRSTILETYALRLDEHLYGGHQDWRQLHCVYDVAQQQYLDDHEFYTPG